MPRWHRWNVILAGLGLVVWAAPSVLAGPCEVKNRICQYGMCDGDGDPATVSDQKTLGQWDQGPRRILLHLSPRYGMGWASIEGGAPGDAMWLDRSYDAGQCWEKHLGLSTIPQGFTTWRTMMYFYVPGGAQLRACGHSTEGTVSCTPWLPVCEDAACDGKDPQGAAEPPSNPTAAHGPRHVVLHISDPVRMAWASIEDGAPGDEVWLDRWWDGQPTWDGLLGRSVTPPGKTAWRTWMFHFNDVAHRGGGRLRACGRQAGTQDFICTDWFRPAQWSAAFAPPPSALGAHALAVDVLVSSPHYDSGRGYWYHPETAGNGWWQSGSVLTTLIDYMIKTGDHRHQWIVDRTFQKNVVQHRQDEHYKDFTNVFIDDSGWWGLAWLRAYDLTGDERYLEAARRVADFMWQKGWDDQSCGGGLLWEPEPRPSWPAPFADPLLQQGKNAITTQLFIKLAAGIFNRSPNDFVQRERAREAWHWLKGSAMVKENPDDLIWDALDWHRGIANCHALPYLWAYTQGVVLGAIAELYRADPDPQLHTELLAVGDRVVVACLRRTGNAGQRFIYGAGPKAGILRERCEEENGWFVNNPYDQAIPSRGIFVRNLRDYHDLNVRLGRSEPASNAAFFLKAQGASLLQKALSDDGRTFGISWTEKQPALVSFLTQATAIDALTATYGLP